LTTWLRQFWMGACTTRPLSRAYWQRGPRVSGTVIQASGRPTPPGPHSSLQWTKNASFGHKRVALVAPENASRARLITVPFPVLQALVMRNQGLLGCRTLRRRDWSRAVPLRHCLHQMAGVLIQSLYESGCGRVLEIHSEEVEASLLRHPTFGNRAAVLIGHWEVDPAVIRPESGTPDDRLRLEPLAVRGHGQTVTHVGNSAYSLHTSGLQVAQLGANERFPLPGHLRPHLGGHGSIQSQDASEDEHHKREQNL